jgi:hypothetical protein
MNFSVFLFCLFVLCLVSLVRSRPPTNHASQPKLKSNVKPKPNTSKKTQSPAMQKKVPLREPPGKQSTARSPAPGNKLPTDYDGVIPDPRFQLPEFRINVEIPSLNSNDRLLFVGSQNAFHGSMVHDGFVKLFEKEMKKAFPQFQAFAYSMDSPSSSSLSSSLLNNTKALFHSFQPTKVVFLFENDILDSFSRSDESAVLSEDHRSLLVERKKELELFLARLINLSNERLKKSSQADISNESSDLLIETVDQSSSFSPLKIILTSFCVVDDCYFYRNKKDPIFEEWNDLLIQLTQFYEDQVSYFDLTAPILKLFDNFPVLKEDQSHRLITYDGKHLNKLGHHLLAVELLNGFAGNMISRMDLPSLMKVITQETETHRKKQEIDLGFSEVVSSSKAREDL